MPTYTRITRNEIPSVDPARRGQIDVNYVYMDERFQTFSFRIPLEDDTPERVREEIRTAAERAELAGPRTIEI